MKIILQIVLPFCTVLFLVTGSLWAQVFPVTVIDQTSTSPLVNPVPGNFQPRYISGFGQDDSFTVFFEERDNGNVISFNSTTSGPQVLHLPVLIQTLVPKHIFV